MQNDAKSVEKMSKPTHSNSSKQQEFCRRHIGPRAQEVTQMLADLGVTKIEELIAKSIPEGIRHVSGFALPKAQSEHQALATLRRMSEKNIVHRSLIGAGYYGCITPPTLLRNIFENPGWYTQYTPYQAEISQGRLEALVNFQTTVSDLTGLPLANASLLDEATAAAEAMNMAYAVHKKKKKQFFVGRGIHPQTKSVLQTRAAPLNIELVFGDLDQMATQTDLFGCLLSYPTTDGLVEDLREAAEVAKKVGATVVVATDLLALTLLSPPGQWGADIAVGSSQRFGVPLGFGGPHAAFMAAKEEFRRVVPGRIIGVSRDRRGKVGYRLALQTREQHIRRDRATSNICTAQVLLAVMAGMYAVYHGPDGLQAIAKRVHSFAVRAAEGAAKLGFLVRHKSFFDTIRIDVGHSKQHVIERATTRGLNVRVYDDNSIGASFDETTTEEDVLLFLQSLSGLAGDQASLSENGSKNSAGKAAQKDGLGFSVSELVGVDFACPVAVERTQPFLEHENFHRYQSEHEFLRYVTRLQAKDLSLTTSMIPLGSCTMKLNAAAEMLPVSWPAFSEIHPYAPSTQTAGYSQLFSQLEDWLASITGMDAVSLQPNSGAQGEYAGLLAIRGYHLSRTSKQSTADRNICLIPTSAHGTNPASAVMAGFRVVGVACDDQGNIDVGDLLEKAKKHAANLGALMITYPSTHGVFEETVSEICDIVHTHGGQVYLDGANMNAQVGLCQPGVYGADVCHLNLHKTFCIPHGGGGPGVGPIAVKGHLEPFLPGDPVGGKGAVAAAAYGSASILPISWMYIQMMGKEGITEATKMAILNANYMAKRLSEDFDILFTGSNGFVAHEFILDCRGFKKTAGIEVEDIAKRLMDFGFHAPTMSWPVAGTLMVEPTESEVKAELDRFCDAMIQIRTEIRDIELGKVDRENNVLKLAPHPADVVCATEWGRSYSREQAAFPAPWLHTHKYWPPVSRVDNAYGDRNLFCTCPPVTLP